MPENITQKEILDIATSIGYYILKYGGEINRVEDTVQRIGLAYHMDAVHVFAISSSIVVTMLKDGNAISQTRRVHKLQTNLERVEQYNALSREICQTNLSYDVLLERIKQIETNISYPFWVSFLAYSLVGGSFSVFFGGGFIESVAGFVIGFILRFVMLATDKFQANPFFANAAGATAIVTLTKLASFIFPSLDIQTTTISVLMLLVPGVLLTNCIRDFVSTDYTAGLSKIVESIFIATAIALGVGVSMLWR